MLTPNQPIAFIISPANNGGFVVTMATLDQLAMPSSIAAAFSDKDDLLAGMATFLGMPPLPEAAFSDAQLAALHASDVVGQPAQALMDEIHQGIKATKAMGEMMADGGRDPFKNPISQQELQDAIDAALTVHEQDAITFFGRWNFYQITGNKEHVLCYGICVGGKDIAEGCRTKADVLALARTRLATVIGPQERETIAGWLSGVPRPWLPPTETKRFDQNADATETLRFLQDADGNDTGVTLRGLSTDTPEQIAKAAEDGLARRSANATETLRADDDDQA